MAASPLIARRMASNCMDPSDISWSGNSVDLYRGALRLEVRGFSTNPTFLVYSRRIRIPGEQRGANHIREIFDSQGKTANADIVPLDETHSTLRIYFPLEKDPRMIKTAENIVFINDFFAFWLGDKD